MRGQTAQDTACIPGFRTLLQAPPHTGRRDRGSWGLRRAPGPRRTARGGRGHGPRTDGHGPRLEGVTNQAQQVVGEPLAQRLAACQEPAPQPQVTTVLSKPLPLSEILSEEEIALIRGLKSVFDPENLLNPGKVVDGPRP